MTDVRATLGLSPVDPDVLKRFGPPTYTEEQVLAYAAATRDGGEAVHTGQLRDEPVSSSGSTRDEAALPEAVGEAGAMPGSNGGFTMAAFKASDVPEGTKLYAAPPPPPVAELPGDVVREVGARAIRREMGQSGVAAMKRSLKAFDAVVALIPRPKLEPDVVRLVIATREVAFGDKVISLQPDGASALAELDAASEAFADRVPWEDEPASRAPSETGES